MADAIKVTPELLRWIEAWSNSQETPRPMAVMKALVARIRELEAALAETQTPSAKWAQAAHTAMLACLTDYEHCSFCTSNGAGNTWQTAKASCECWRSKLSAVTQTWPHGECGATDTRDALADATAPTSDAMLAARREKGGGANG